MARYLVTGAAGFIGSNLSRELLDRGHTVRGLDNFETGRRENLNGILDDEDFEFINGDVRDEADVNRSVANIDYILHQAAVPSVPRSIENPKLSIETNCLGTLNLLDAARCADVKKVVVASSSSVYGPSEELPKHEGMPVNPVSPYALSKYFTERLTTQFSDYYEIDTVALRYFNVFGPHQDPKGEYAAVIPKFISMMLDGEQPVIYGDGEQSRDFTYVKNVIEANLKACKSDCTGVAVNVACNNRVTINELVNEINKVLGTDIDPVYEDPRPGDVRHSMADIQKAVDLLDYTPSVSFREGLKQTIKYYQN